jgi:signal transduction histidine kinase
VFELLSGSELTLAYYLFKLFGIQAAFFIALGQWQRHTSFRARRLTIAFGGLTILHLLLLLVSAISTYDNPLAVPFERTVDVASLGFLLWGFTPFFRERDSMGTMLLSGNTVLAFMAFIVTFIFWDGSDFNESVWETLFTIWQVVLLTFGIVNCSSRYNDERLFVLFSFGIMLIGYLLNFFMAGGHIPVFVRLSEMVAYSLLVVAIYQGAMQSLASRSQELQNLSEISLDQIKGLISLSEATKQITASLDVSKVLDGATQSIATALDADQCAIALPDDESNISQLRLVSIYNPSRKGRGEAVRFSLNDQTAIKHTIKHKQEIQVDEYQDDSQIQLLFVLMGANDAGPLLIQPLLLDDVVIGVLILGNSVSKRVFTTAEVELNRSLADQVSVAIRHAKEYASVSGKAQQLSWTLRNQELETGKRRAAMETELKKNREEVSLFSQRLYDYEVAQKDKETELKQAKERVAKLEKTIERAKTEVEKFNRKDKEFITLSTELEKYQQQAADLEVERNELQEKIKQLSQEATEVERLNETLEATNQRVRKLARALKRAKSSSQTTMPTFLPGDGGYAELENLSCGVVIGDADHRVKQVNTIATQLLAKGDGLVGQPLSEIIDDEQWQTTVSQLDNKQLISNQFKIGENVIQTTISLILQDGKDDGTITMIYDITTETKTQQAKDEFIASLAQDLQTPMTSIVGYTELLLSDVVGNTNKLQHKFLQRIKANTNRMGNMLGDLISVTTIDAGQLELHPVAVDIAEIIEDAVIGFRTELEEKDIVVEQQLLNEMSLLVEADPDSTRQIMANILGNAISVTPNGHPIFIKVALHTDDVDTPFLEISVQDSGGGIVNKDLPRVFDRFYRAGTPLIQGLGETGVGLAVAKALVEANGGQIWTHSEIGEGTTFSFILPISEQPDDPWSSFLGTLPPLDLSSDK